MVYLIVFLPLLGSIIAGFWGRRLGDKLSLYLTSTLLLISMTLSWITFGNYHQIMLIKCIH